MKHEAVVHDSMKHGKMGMGVSPYTLGPPNHPPHLHLTRITALGHGKCGLGVKLVSLAGGGFGTSSGQCVETGHTNMAQTGLFGTRGGPDLVTFQLIGVLTTCKYV